jgi:membrane protein
MKARLKLLFDVVKASVASASDDQVPMMGAALAYYMMFSIAPLLVIAIGAAGIVFGKSASTRIFDGMSGVIGVQSAQTIHSMVSAAADKPHASVAATVVGVVTLLVGASGVFQQLQQSLNIIWRVAPEPGATWRLLLRGRLLSFGMVAVIGVLLMFSLFVSTAISAAGAWIGGVAPSLKFLWSAADVLISLALVSGLFAAVLKLVPDVRLSWKDVGVGGALTALLFVVGKTALGFYLGRSALASSYGAAGSLIVVLLWVFFSSQILFFGAELTRALFLRGGRAVEPKRGTRLTAITFVAATAPSRAGQRRRSRRRRTSSARRPARATPKVLREKGPIGPGRRSPTRL